jgi:hypothetical protein
MTRPYSGRSTADRVDSLGHIEEWIPPGVERVYAIEGSRAIPSAAASDSWSRKKAARTES